MFPKVNVKKVGSDAGKFGAATLGLVAGSKVANMIGGLTLPDFIPAVVAEHLKKAAPGVLLMLLAYFANAKFAKGSELQKNMVEAGSLGVGLAGFANLVKAYFPEIAAQWLPSLQGPGDMSISDTNLLRLGAIRDEMEMPSLAPNSRLLRVA